jgi:hypothetical protein
VRTALHAERDTGALIVVPYQPFRSFPWNGQRTTLDPLPRYAGVEVVRPDTLTIGSTRLAGEDPRAAAVAAALESDDPVPGLLDAGVGWVAVEHDTPGVVPDGLTDDLLEVVTRSGRLDGDGTGRPGARRRSGGCRPRGRVCLLGRAGATHRGGPYRAGTVP